MADMSTYLPTKTAEYTTTELTLIPQVKLTEEPVIPQAYHEFDNGDLEVVSLADVYFKVTIQWDYLSDIDGATLLDFYHDKTEGMKKSFYWQHPLDSNTYVARFLAPLTIQDVGKKVAKDTPIITLGIEGVKA
jgi:hypothetical protein